MNNIRLFRLSEELGVLMNKKCVLYKDKASPMLGEYKQRMTKPHVKDFNFLQCIGKRSKYNMLRMICLPRDKCRQNNYCSIP